MQRGNEGKYIEELQPELWKEETDDLCVKTSSGARAENSMTRTHRINQSSIPCPTSADCFGLISLYTIRVPEIGGKQLLLAIFPAKLAQA
jgi:hypothetical protein